MLTRRAMKREARRVFKRHYWIFVMLCLLAAVLGTEFSSSLSVAKSGGDEAAEAETGGSRKGSLEVNEKFSEIVYHIASGDDETGLRIADDVDREESEQSEANPGAVMGRSRGVFSMVVNGITSGKFFAYLAVGLKSIIGSDSMAVMILIATVLLLWFLVLIFVTNVYQVIMRRMFLEGRRYDKIHMSRALFLLKIHKWCRASITLFVASVYQLLWSVTIVGGIIKYYSYYLVPYIVAENPGLNSKEAVTLSRHMMKGHKWECFVFELSFIGWELLGLLTMGILDIFYTNPYKIAAFSEYYAGLRMTGKEKNLPYADLLNDKYLFENAGKEELADVYRDVAKESEKQLAGLTSLTGIRKFLSDVFGLTVRNDEKSRAFEESQASMVYLGYDKDALEGSVYPTRLSPEPERMKKRWTGNISYIRNYSVWSMIMLFFVMSFIGWLWEVGLHLLSDGVFVNRGVLHGPWLPIYGSGCLLILLLLNKFRKRPAAEFLMTIVVCGIVEYFTAYYLEIAHNGKKWWDYSGYFLNLQGRICAEGLLTFGVGGMLIVYILAPVLDDLIRRVPVRTLMIACVVLICIFTADQVYSVKYPNEGAGITDYSSAADPAVFWKTMAAMENKYL